MVPFSVDVHCAQWGTLPRLLAACQNTGIDGLAVDENTRTTWRRGTLEVAGLGHAYLARKNGKSVRVRRFAAGEAIPVRAHRGMS